MRTLRIDVCLQLFGLISILSGCGRIGVELVPLEGIGEEDSGIPGDELDGGADLDADSVDDAEPSPDDATLIDADGANEGGAGGDDASTDGCIASASSDTTCDGVDDDCSGSADEDFASTATSCGVGVCARTGMQVCMAGSVGDTCVAGMPSATVDDATGTGNGLDDDCDGSIDEDVPSCDATPRTFEAGVHTNIPVPSGCSSATIQLWGGAGAAGGEAGIAGDAKSGGRGGSGGYASSTLTLSGPLTLWIGNGGSMGCNTAGTNAGAAATYSGGSGGTGDGANGADGMVAGGGSGANPSTGGAGGRGYFGGGGGGASPAIDAVNGPGANGGGGGAASVVLLNGTRVLVAGGGGGGGGASPLVYNFGETGGNGGEGCSGAGSNGETSRGGGGGGGGVCMGTSVMAGMNGTPANAASVPAPRARGTTSNCGAGGNGYAIVTFTP